MLTLTSSLEEAIAARVQPARVRLKVYASDRTTLLETLTKGFRLSRDGQRTRPVRRAITLDVDSPDGQYSPDPEDLSNSRFWSDKWIGVEFGYLTRTGSVEYLTVGKFGVSGATPAVSDRGNVVRVRAESGEKRLQVSFGAVTSFEDTPTISADYAKDAGASASATTSLAAGQEIQRQASIRANAYATVGGIRSAVLTMDNDENTDPRLAIDGSTDTWFKWRHDEDLGADFSKFEVDFELDLGTVETVTSVTPVIPTGGWGSLEAGSLEMSVNGATWSAFVAGSSLRYLRFTCLGDPEDVDEGETSRIIELAEVQVVTAAAYPASNAVDADTGTAWRPSWTDLDRELTIDLGQSRTFNQVLVAVGLHDRDLWNRCKMELATSADSAAYTVQETTTKHVAGTYEFALAAAVTARYVRIRILSRKGITAVRDVAVYSVTATNTISYLVTQIAAGEVSTGIKRTWRYYPYTIGYAAKEERLSAIRKLADSIGWEYLVGADDIPVFRPVDVDPTDPTWTFTEGIALIQSAEADISPKDIVNTWMVSGATAQSRPVSATVQDGDLSSPTCWQRIGVLYNEAFDALCDTEDKCRARGTALLRESTKVAIPVKLTGLAVPALEEGDAVTLELPSLKLSGADLVDTENITVDAATGALGMTLSLVRIPR